MTDEEVFVGAMNAAINGLMAARGEAIFDMAENEMKSEPKLSFALDMIDEVVELSSKAAWSAVRARDNFNLEKDKR